MRFGSLLSGLLLVAAGHASAETVPDREGAVRADKTQWESSDRWNYSDVEGGFAKARATGKPLLVVLRCIPCLACMGIDTSVLGEEEITPLLDQFICVRVINANALDLRLFQFDYDLSFSAILFNGDGTIYGRYGSWLHQKNSAEKSLASFRQALEAGLALHRNYPANKSLLAGKQGGPTPFKTPTEFPTLAKYQSKLDWDGKVVQSCVHCHMIGDAFRTSYRSAGKAVPADWIYPQPSAEILGLVLATNERAKVESVAPGTPASKAGLQAGDTLSMLNGQPLLSIADVSWALHRAPATGLLPILGQRQGKQFETQLELPAGWRQKSDISRRVGTWPMRAMAFGGLKIDDLEDAERAQLGLSRDSMALKVKHLGGQGEHGAAKRAGFQPRDILVEVDGLKKRLTESALIGHLLEHHRPGDKVPAVVLRGKEKVSLQLPQQ